MFNDNLDLVFSNVNIPFIKREIIKFFELKTIDEKTFLVIAALHKDVKKNNVTKISCKKGMPIPGLAYDNQSDCYLFSCISHFELGSIPFSVKMTHKENSAWKISVPLPEKTIKRFLTDYQKKSIKNFMSQFNGSETDFRFIQFVDVN